MCPVSLFPQSRAHEPLQVFRQLCPVRYRNTSPSSDMANPTVRDRLCGRGDDHSESGSGPALVSIGLAGVGFRGSSAGSLGRIDQSACGPERSNASPDDRSRLWLRVAR